VRPQGLPCWAQNDSRWKLARSIRWSTRLCPRPWGVNDDDPDAAWLLLCCPIPIEVVRVFQPWLDVWQLMDDNNIPVTGGDEGGGLGTSYR
jgi:hypothetical protein